MKTSFLATGLFLLTLGTAYAQQLSADTTRQTTTTRVVVTPTPANPMLPPADAARERARLANAELLRQEATTPPAKVSTNIPLSPMQVEGAAVPAPAPPPSSEEVARVRAQQEREMIAKALTKKGQKGSKATTKQIKQEKRAGAR